jgi:hypothetical protein
LVGKTRINEGDGVELGDLPVSYTHDHR